MESTPDLTQAYLDVCARGLDDASLGAELEALRDLARQSGAEAWRLFLEGRIQYCREQFEQALHEVDSVDQVLPFYVASLPFYQRVFAAALANSMRCSMQKSGIQGLSYRQAKVLLADNRQGRST